MTATPASPPAHDVRDANAPGVLLQGVVLAVLVGANFVVGALGSLATREAVDGWYADAEKVPWNPPDAVFGPVWSLLYVLMGVAAWLVWRRAGWAPARRALTLYVVQLAFNAAWTPIFFAGRYAWLALVVIVVLLGLVVATALAFRRHSRVAAWLLVPYALWVAYATSLNLGIAVLN
ncbi:tryptophan-rich sensory protein [Cellulomonas sp. DKR-3]|uniref:Tryptophan-rich sensory protein n=1 Tax=Cellulomonas fulva TaxID=2835530 RepID=A0ABS5U0Z0_9CELL|nr:TspO/MBR family protein [Cellulomonas fulva]MBT0995016.1 tryptophan-rich sensory protein [Cellulomonas fulva]